MSDYVHPFTHALLAQIRAIADIATRSDGDFNRTELALIEGALNEAAGRLRFKRNARQALDRAFAKAESKYWEDYTDGGAA
jgi:hypothetical protein